MFLAKTFVDQPAIKALKSPKAIAYSRDLSLADGNVSYPGAGGKPIAILVIGGRNAQVNQLGMSFVDGNKVVAGAWMLSGTGVWLGDVARGGADGGTYALASFVSFDDDGVTLSWTKGGSPAITLSFTIVYFF